MASPAEPSRKSGRWAWLLGNPEAEALYMSPHLRRWRQLTDVPLMILAIGSLPMLLVELKHDNLSDVDQWFVNTVNIVVLIAFAVDYIVELRFARNRSVFVRSEYLSLLIVISQGVAVIPTLGLLGVLRSLRAVRLFRFLAIGARAVAIGGAASRDGRRLIRKHAASIGIGAAAMTWVTAAAAFTVAEDVGEGRRVHSFFDALWWSLSTITTVGYGDIYPITAAGRIIGGFTMIVGISTFALITAKVAEYLVRSDNDENEE